MDIDGMNEIIILFLGILAGGVSFLVIQFWMNPLLRYIEIKHQVTSDLVFYANVIDAENLNEEMQQRHRDRQEQNRKHGAEIRASYYRLPLWYKKYLTFVKEDPIKASKALIGLSNSSEYDIGNKFTTQLLKSLRIPGNVEE